MRARGRTVETGCSGGIGRSPAGRHTLVGVLSGLIAACAVPAPGPDPALAQLRIVQMPDVDAAQLSLPSLTVLVEVSAAIANPSLTAPSDIAKYAQHACATAQSFVSRLKRGTPIRIQPFTTRRSNTSSCAIEIGRRPATRLAPDVWQVDSPARAVRRWADDPERSGSRIQLIANLDSGSAQELCQLAAERASEGLWVESIRLDGGPPVAGCLEGPPEAPLSHLQELLQSAGESRGPLRILRPGPSGERSVLFRGEAGGEIIELSPGLVIVVLEGSGGEDEELGPFVLRPGTLTTVRTVPVASDVGRAGSTAAGPFHWWELEQTRASQSP